MIAAMRIGPIVVLANALALLSAPAGAAEPGDLYVERAAVRALDGRCDLFEPRLADALEAAAAQARGAALRAGADPVALESRRRAAEARARRAPCDSADAQLVRDRVRAAFGDWARTPRMTYDGWRAERGSQRAVWRMSQGSRTGASPVTFGLPDFDADAPAAVVSFVGDPRPYAARIVMRETRSRRPNARRIVWASGAETARKELLAEGRREGQLWRFPATALDALAELDPRETFQMEFVFRDDSVARATFRVGDVAAGRAFVKMGPLERRAP